MTAIHITHPPYVPDPVRRRPDLNRLSPAQFEAVAARIRVLAAEMLAELPVEEPVVAWARRAVLVGTKDPRTIGKPFLDHGIWKWSKR